MSRKTSNYLNTDHNELIVTDKDTINIIPDISIVYDEPFSDPSQIPTLILSKFAKQKVTVVLTGDGGDEVFGGYNRHLYANKIFNQFNGLPQNLKKVLNLFIQNLPNYFYTIIAKMTGISEIKEKIQKVFNIFQAQSLPDLYLTLVSSNFPMSNNLVKTKNVYDDLSFNLEVVNHYLNKSN